MRGGLIASRIDEIKRLAKALQRYGVEVDLDWLDNAMVNEEYLVNLIYGLKLKLETLQWHESIRRASAA